jgi:hypothetical protein
MEHPGQSPLNRSLLEKARGKEKPENIRNNPIDLKQTTQTMHKLRRTELFLYRFSLFIYN